MAFLVTACVVGLYAPNVEGRRGRHFDGDKSECAQRKEPNKAGRRDGPCCGRQELERTKKGGR